MPCFGLCFVYTLHLYSVFSRAVSPHLETSFHFSTKCSIKQGKGYQVSHWHHGNYVKKMLDKSPSKTFKKGKEKKKREKLIVV